jgi:hypothetical protein
MRFTLTYRGPLRGSSGGTAHKHEVRRALHPQLRELWQHEPLNRMAEDWLNPDPDNLTRGRALRQVGGHSLAVVVQSDLKLVAELDILLLRPEAPGAILQRADIDNRLKTLFDALRCPGNLQEIPTDWKPATEEQPLFCLLDDDRLITRVNVDTERLLAPRSKDDVDLMIRVQLRASSPTYASMQLIY